MSLTKKLQQNTSRGSVKPALGLLIGLVLVFLSVMLLVNRQAVADWVAYQEYKPTTEIAQISSKLQLTDKGRFYFYVSKPEVQPATEFNRSCERKESTSAILGCYAAERIYVYNVTDTRLNGIKEVTAAHEMLHAAYQRLSDTEKSKVNGLLDQAYDKAKSDEELTKRMDFYAEHEAGEHYNELHSIVATEFPVISDELEQYYKEYFVNRAAVVELHDSYADVFGELKEKADQLILQLKELGPKIELTTKQYNADVKQLNADIQDFNQRATNGGFTSRGDFDSQRAQLVARTRELDTTRSQINRDIQTYEDLREEYNQTAASSNELYKSMDSQLAPAPNL